jgi:hypothetical protein
MKMKMNKTRKILVKIPLIGYLFRIISAILFLPRHISNIHNTINHQKSIIEDLQKMSYRANIEIIEQGEKIEQLKKSLK